MVVALVCALFLFHLRSALVAIVTLPVGILVAFIVMYYQGVNANILSLGGIAIAVGAMVDAALIAVYRPLLDAVLRFPKATRRRTISRHDTAAASTRMRPTTLPIRGVLGFHHVADAGVPLAVTVYWAKPDAKAWAPETAYRNGKYYFYVPVGGDKMGVAVADHRKDLSRTRALTRWWTRRAMRTPGSSRSTRPYSRSRMASPTCTGTRVPKGVQR